MIPPGAAATMGSYEAAWPTSVTSLQPSFLAVPTAWMLSRMIEPMTTRSHPGDLSLLTGATKSVSVGP